MTENLELTTQPPAAIEKRLAGHKKNILAYVNGVNRSGAQLFGYAFLAGREMNLAAEVLPHGKLLPWMDENFPKLSKGTIDNWRAFATNINGHFARLTKLKPLQLKKTFSETEQSLILETIPKVMDGQGMIDFNRACKFLDAPAPAGGLHPSTDATQEFLKEKFPDHAGKSYAELPTHIKAQVRKHVLRQPHSKNAVDQSKAANKAVENRTNMLNAWATEASGTFLDQCDRATLKAFEEARLALGRAIEKAQEKRK